MAKSRFTLTERDALALRVLRGEPAAQVARDAGITPSTLGRYMNEAVTRHPDFNLRDYFRELRKPGQGVIRASMAYYATLTQGVS